MANGMNPLGTLSESMQQTEDDVIVVEDTEEELMNGVKGRKRTHSMSFQNAANGMGKIKVTVDCSTNNNNCGLQQV